MSTGDHPKDSAEEMSSSLPPLKWSEEIFDCLVKNFKFPKSWGVMYPEDGQTAAQAPADYITLFWDYFNEGNFRLPVTRFFLDILGYYKFHISQLNPMGMVWSRHFEFLCRSMHIEPSVDPFRVFYQLHSSQGFYSFPQRPAVKKILLAPPKSFHEWKTKFFYIKRGVIPVKMNFRGAEDIVVETPKTPEAEIWALVAAGMSLHWKAEPHDKPVYVEDDNIVALYVVAYKRENGKMTTIQKGANEETWYHHIVKNFALSKDVDLNAQPSTDIGELMNLGVGPEFKTKKRRPVATTISKKIDVPKADIRKEETKKGTRLVSEPWCDYVVVSDTLEGLAPVAMKKPKPEPRDTADIPRSNPKDPIDVESSPKPLVRTKAVKRNQPEGEAAAQPAKKITRKKISKKDLDALAVKLSPACSVRLCRIIICF
ncbi:hypothetical protein Hdeb2414_s0085g00783031 [Helianthus debilis subsp. tardiflorus]